MSNLTYNKIHLKDTSVNDPMEIVIEELQDFLCAMAFNGLKFPVCLSNIGSDEFFEFLDKLNNDLKIIIDNHYKIFSRPPKLGEVFRALNKEKSSYIDGAEKEQRDLALKWSKEEINKYCQKYKANFGKHPVYVPCNLFSGLIPLHSDMSSHGIYWHELLGAVRYYVGDETSIASIFWNDNPNEGIEIEYNKKNPSTGDLLFFKTNQGGTGCAIQPQTVRTKTVGICTNQTSNKNSSKECQSDTVHPLRYNQYSLEAWDILERIYGTKAVALWCEMTAMKYRLRLRHKDAVEKELEKEKIYLQKAKELRNKKTGIFPESL